jgi:hypothetical protein
MKTVVWLQLVDERVSGELEVLVVSLGWRVVDQDEEGIQGLVDDGVVQAFWVLERQALVC